MAEKKNSALVKAEKATSGDPVEKQTGEREETNTRDQGKAESGRTHRPRQSEKDQGGAPRRDKGGGNAQKTGAESAR